MTSCAVHRLLSTFHLPEMELVPAGNSFLFVVVSIFPLIFQPSFKNEETNVCALSTFLK